MALLRHCQFGIPQHPQYPEVVALWFPTVEHVFAFLSCVEAYLVVCAPVVQSTLAVVEALEHYTVCGLCSKASVQVEVVGEESITEALVLCHVSGVSEVAVPEPTGGGRGLVSAEAGAGVDGDAAKAAEISAGGGAKAAAA